METTVPVTVVCSIPGAKERAEIYEAFENIYPILRGFRKQ